MSKHNLHVLCLAAFILSLTAIFSLTSFVLAQGTSAQKSSDEKDVNKQTGQVNPEAHRSAVANFVQTLLKTASTTKGGIGEQVRIIAREQNEASTTTEEALKKIQTRSKIKTFLIGSDYKNLGTLRSFMVQTRNRLDQLNRVMGKATTTPEIQTQIQALEQEQTKIESFIKTQESKFSLFGWLRKMFIKTPKN